MTLFKMKISFLKTIRTFRKFSTDTKWIQPSGTDQGIMIYNPIQKKKVPLILPEGNTGTWYSCGPTVYDSAHIGHACCYMKLDILQRILTDYFRINLITAMGVTDIDDKIINRSNSTGKPCEEITKNYEAEFWKNLTDLDIKMPDLVLRVTDHIATIREFIEKIESDHLCYKAKDDSIFFDTEAYGHYGKFVQMQENVTEDQIHLPKFKKNPSDFALWKSSKEGEPFWESRWGKGRPGWHIECSAMVSRVFGSQVDFHAGGIDLKFPHHENEEAQSCAFHGGQQWVNYWIHTGHLSLRDDVKMSKSLKNTLSIDDILAKHSPSVFRMACLSSTYRNHMEFNEALMEMAGSTLDKLKSFLEICNSYLNNSVDITAEDETLLWNSFQNTVDEVDKSLRDDFNTSGSINSIMRLVGDVNKVFHKNQTKDTNLKGCSDKAILIASISKYISCILRCFGLELEKSKATSDNRLPDVIDLLVNFRNSVRKNAIQNKNKELLLQCDSVRDELKKVNISIQDRPDSPTWNYVEK